MLPIAKIGSILSKGQWTEEMPDSTEQAPGKGDFLVNFNHPSVTSGNYTTVISEAKALAYIQYSAHLPTNHSTEIVSPPPDTVLT